MIALKAALIIVATLPAGVDAIADPAIRGARARVAPGPSPVTEPVDRGYYVRDVTGPGGARTPVLDVPASVTALPRSVLDDEQALGGALRNTPGVTGIRR
jgi:outer membrane receptor for monomeric catechols